MKNLTGKKKFDINNYIFGEMVNSRNKKLQFPPIPPLPTTGLVKSSVCQKDKTLLGSRDLTGPRTGSRKS